MNIPVSSLSRVLLSVLFLFGTAYSLKAAAFIKFEGIEGESEIILGLHNDASDVLSWSWGVKPPESDRARGSGVADELNVTHYLDKSSPLLSLACLQGTIFSKVDLFVYRPISGGNGNIVQITLTGAKITSISTSGSSDEDRPVGDISLSFDSIRYIYNVYEGNTWVDSEIMTWDVEAGTP